MCTPTATLVRMGVTAIETSGDGLTTTVAVAKSAPSVARIDVVPAPMPVAIPRLDTEATVGSTEVQTADVVTSW